MYEAFLEKFLENFKSKDAFLAFLKQNLSMIVIIIALIYRFYKNYGPIPEVEGSKVQIVRGVDDWEKKLASAKERKQLVIVDFYAQWCPPCKLAGPEFAKLSKEPDMQDVMFLKVDVDKSGKVAQLNQIKSMPTFQLFKDGTMVDILVGYAGSDKIKELIQKHVSSKKNS